MNARDFIMEQTGIGELDWHGMLYDQGQRFLELMESDDQETYNRLLRLRTYWTWWQQQFDKLCKEWIQWCGEEKIFSRSKEQNKAHLETFLGFNKVPDRGIESYSYLLEEVLK